VFFLQKAIKELTDTQKEQGTSVERVKQITDELIPLKEQLAILLGKETEAMKEAREEREESIKAIEKEDNARKSLLATMLKELRALESDLEGELAVTLDQQRDLQTANIQRTYNDRVRILATSLSEQLLSQDEFDVDLMDAKSSRDAEMLKAEQDYQDAIFAINKKAADDLEDLGDEEEAANKEQQEGRIELAFAGVNTLSSLVSSIAQMQQNAFAAEQDELTKQLDQGLITREEFDNKTTEIKRKQAQSSKDAALFQAIISTASSIAEALPNIPLSVLAGVIGAAKIAAIASAPLPQFAEGVIGLKGKGTETSDEIPAMLSLNESVMTGAETRKYNAELWAMRNGTFDKLMKEKYSVPKIDASLFSGWGDMGKSAEMNGLMATLKDHNIIAALDRSRQSQTNGFKYLAKELTHNKRQNSRLGW